MLSQSSRNNKSPDELECLDSETSIIDSPFTSPFVDSDSASQPNLHSLANTTNPVEVVLDNDLEVENQRLRKQLIQIQNENLILQDKANRALRKAENLQEERRRLENQLHNLNMNFLSANSLSQAIQKRLQDIANFYAQAYFSALDLKNKLEQQCIYLINHNSQLQFEYHVLKDENERLIKWLDFTLLLFDFNSNHSPLERLSLFASQNHNSTAPSIATTQIVNDTTQSHSSPRP